MSRSHNDRAKPLGGRPDLPQLWLHLVHSPWSSLAIIPVDASTPARQVAASFQQMEDFFDLGAFRFLDGEGASLTDGSRLAKDLSQAVASGMRVVASVDSPRQNPGAIPLVMAAEAAILLVRLGAARLEPMRGIVDIVGRERILGCVALHGAREPEPVPPVVP